MEAQADIKRTRGFGGPLLMIGLIVGAVVAAVWGNIWKSELKIEDVRVDGNTMVTDKEILSLANISKDQKLYSVDLLAAQKRIMQVAFIKSVAVNREAPNRITITVTERVPIAAVVLDRIAFLDADGVVLPPAHSDNVFDLPVLTGAFQSREFIPGKQIARSDVKEALGILVTAQQLSDELYRQISEVHTETGKDVMLYTAESGVPVVFGRGDVGAKLVKFDAFWKEIVLHRGAHELAYIDLRFEDQVIVRWNYDTEEVQTRS